MLLVFVSCTKGSQNEKNVAVVKDYYSALNAGSYQTIEKLVASNFKNYGINNTIISVTKETYKDIFQWDSIFAPNYKIVSIEAKSDTVYANIEKQCKRIDFLHKVPIKINIAFILQDNMIAKRLELSYDNVDWDFWFENKNKLTDFVKENHPGLLDFDKFQNKDYGKRFLNVINLYQKEH
jgi:hypothetical protein